MNTRDRIVQAAAELLAQQGREAVSTRAVAEAANVQVPTLYRLFGDMRGLLDAVASYGFAVYIEDKLIPTHDQDPIEAIRLGWDLHVAFALANPALYTVMYSEPQPASTFAAAARALHMLQELVGRIAASGRLRLGVDQAAQIMQAACRGVTLSLLDMQPEARDLTLSTLVREAMLNAITLPVESSIALATLATHDSQSRVVSRAVALKAVLPEAITLTPAEQSLLSEWLDRLSQPRIIKNQPQEQPAQ